jgi:hypothetical protein
MRKSVQARYIAAEIHAFLFISMWVLYVIFSQPMANGPSQFPFLILLIADLPISLIAFGVMFTSSQMGSIAALIWGVLGTLWWFAIGLAIDARIRSYREKRGLGTGLFPTIITANSVVTYSRRKELLIAASVVAVLVIGSIALEWVARTF